MLTAPDETSALCSSIEVIAFETVSCIAKPGLYDIPIDLYLTYTPPGEATIIEGCMGATGACSYSTSVLSSPQILSADFDLGVSNTDIVVTGA